MNIWLFQADPNHRERVVTLKIVRPWVFRRVRELLVVQTSRNAILSLLEQFKSVDPTSYRGFTRNLCVAVMFFSNLWNNRFHMEKACHFLGSVATVIKKTLITYPALTRLFVIAWKHFKVLPSKRLNACHWKWIWKRSESSSSMRARGQHFPSNKYIAMKIFEKLLKWVCSET